MFTTYLSTDAYAYVLFMMIITAMHILGERAHFHEKILTLHIKYAKHRHHKNCYAQSISRSTTTAAVVFFFFLPSNRIKYMQKMTQKRERLYTLYERDKDKIQQQRVKKNMHANNRCNCCCKKKKPLYNQRDAFCHAQMFASYHNSFCS